MTWIVGAGVPFLGYAVAISDIRVTFGNEERDCLQKIYQVGHYLAAGFAGSVEIGFEMIRSLQEGLKVEDPSLAWDPAFVVQEWPATARKIFKKYPAATQGLGAQLILLGSHPTEDIGIPGKGRPYIYSFSWPEFEPIQAEPYEVLSIGSGSSVAPYCELLKRYSSDHDFRSLLVRGESMPGGTATMLGSYVTSVLKRNPTPGVSQHLHLCVARRSDIQIWSNDHSQAGRWETWSLGPPSGQSHEMNARTDNFRMPRVATTFEELRAMLNGEARNLDSVVC